MNQGNRPLQTHWDTYHDFDGHFPHHVSVLDGEEPRLPAERKLSSAGRKRGLSINRKKVSLDLQLWLLLRVIRKRFLIASKETPNGCQ